MEQYTLKKRFSFEAGHVLPHHDGKCSRPHGHSYKLDLAIRGSELNREGPKQGMLIDFQDVSIIVKQMIRDHLDHHWLNDSLQLDSPTAERIAQWIFQHLKPKLPGLDAVTLHETETCSVTYTES